MPFSRNGRWSKGKAGEGARPGDEQSSGLIVRCVNLSCPRHVRSPRRYLLSLPAYVRYDTVFSRILRRGTASNMKTRHARS